MITLGYLDFSKNSLNSDPKDCLWNAMGSAHSYHLISEVKISNAIFDNLTGRYIDDTDYFDFSNGDPIDFNFSYDVIFKANFEGDFSAGSMKFVDTNSIGINIKRRIKNSNLPYELIYTHPFEDDQADDQDDFIRIFFSDQTARANTEYEYYPFPIIVDRDGTVYEQSYVDLSGEAPSIIPQLDGIAICGEDTIYHTFIEDDVVAQRNKPSSVVVPVGGRKTPYVITNGDISYYSGTAKGLFGVQNECIITPGDYKLRSTIMDFLHRGEAYLLKKGNGEMWLVKTTGEAITEDHSQHPDKAILSFDWTEVGDCDSLTDLAIHGIISPVYELDSLAR